MKVLAMQGLEAKEGVDEGEFDFFSSIYGEILYDSKTTEFPGGLTVDIYNEKNQKVSTQTTSESGKFKFPETGNGSENYSFDVLNIPDSLIKNLMSIELKNADGSLRNALQLANNGRFMFEKMETVAPEDLAKKEILEENNFDLMYSISGNYDYKDGEGNFPNKLHVYAYDGNGNKVGEVFTDEEGNFVFETSARVNHNII